MSIHVGHTKGRWYDTCGSSDSCDQSCDFCKTRFVGSSARMPRGADPSIFLFSLNHSEHVGPGRMFDLARGITEIAALYQTLYLSNRIIDPSVRINDFMEGRAVVRESAAFGRVQYDRNVPEVTVAGGEGSDCSIRDVLAVLAKKYMKTCWNNDCTVKVSVCECGNVKHSQRLHIQWNFWDSDSMPALLNDPSAIFYNFFQHQFVNSCFSITAVLSN